MKKKIQIVILLLSFGILVSQGTLTAYAETEGSGEGGSMAVTQSDNVSADSTLSSLKIAQAVLHPEFDPDQLTYTATVPYEVDRVALNAQTNCPDARKVIRGTGDLEVGENTVTVTVTAQNGSTREYRITLTRQEMVQTSAPEGGETVDVPQTTGEETQPVTSEPGNEDPSVSESADATEPQGDTTAAATTPSETIMVPPDTEGNGGMVVETPAEDASDDDSLFSDRTVVILLFAAICPVSLFAILAAVIIRRESDDDGDQWDDGELEEEESNEKLRREDEHKEIPKAQADRLAEAPAESTTAMSMDDETEEPVGWDDFEEVSAEPTKAAQDKSDDDPDDDADDDLDDDFEVLLEEDDDFDFLDF